MLGDVLRPSAYRHRLTLSLVEVDIFEERDLDLVGLG